MKKFVRIQSDINIKVTAGLQSVDMTNKDAHVGDRLRVAEAWSGQSVLITKGVGFYPAEIKNWNTVKALEKEGYLTIGEETDTTGNEEKDAQVASTKAALKREADKYINATNKADEEKKRAAKLRAEEIAQEAKELNTPSF